MDLLESEPETLAALPHQDWMERGGTEGVEMIIWLAMRAALGAQVRRVHRNYAVPTPRLDRWRWGCVSVWRAAVEGLPQ